MRIIGSVTKTFHLVGEAVIAIVMLVVVVNVASRMLRMPIPASVELGMYGTAIVISFILARVQFEERQISMDLLTSCLKGRPVKILKNIGRFIALITVAIFIWGAFLVAQDAFALGEYSSVLRLPVPPFRVIWGFGMLLFFIVTLFQFIRGVSKGDGK